MAKSKDPWGPNYGNNEALAAVIITISTKTTEYSRTVYALLDMFGEIGGLNDAMSLGFSFLFGLFSTKIFLQQVVTKEFDIIPKKKYKPAPLAPTGPLSSQDVGLLLERN